MHFVTAFRNQESQILVTDIVFAKGRWKVMLLF